MAVETIISQIKSIAREREGVPVLRTIVHVCMVESHDEYHPTEGQVCFINENTSEDRLIYIDGEGYMARRVLKDGRLGWLLFTCEQVEDQRNLYTNIEPKAIVFLEKKGVAKLFSTGSRIDRLLSRFRDRASKLQTRLNDDEGILIRELTSTERNLISEVVAPKEMRWFAVSRRGVLSSLAILALALAATRCGPEPSGDILVPTPGSQNPTPENSEESGVTEEAEGEEETEDEENVEEESSETEEPVEEEDEESPEQEVNPNSWEYFNSLERDEAIEWLEEYGSDVGFEVGRDAQIIVVRSSDGTIVGRADATGLVSTGFRVLKQDEFGKDRVEHLCNQNHSSVNSVWAEVDYSSVTPSAGTNTLGLDTYRVLVYLGDYGADSRRMSDGEEMVVRRIDGIVGVAGNCRVTSSETAKFFVNPLIALERLASHAREIQIGGELSLKYLFDLMGRAIRVYRDEVANEVGFIVDGAGDVVQGGNASNVCIQAREVYEALSQLIWRLWSLEYSGIPVITERHIHDPIYQDGQPMLLSDPYPTILYYEQGNWRTKDDFETPSEVYRFLNSHPSAVVHPYAGFGDSPRNTDQWMNHIGDTGGMLSDVMIGTYHDFRFFLPPGSCVRTFTRFIPLSSDMEVSVRGHNYSIAIDQVVFTNNDGSLSVSEVVVDRLNEEAMDDLMHRELRLSSETMVVYQTLGRLRDEIRSGEISKDTLDSYLKELLENRFYLATVARFMSEVEQYLYERETTVGVSQAVPLRIIHDLKNLLLRLVDSLEEVDLVGMIMRIQEEADVRFYGSITVVDEAFEENRSLMGSNENLQGLYLLALLCDIGDQIVYPQFYEFMPYNRLSDLFFSTVANADNILSVFSDQ